MFTKLKVHKFLASEAIDKNAGIVDLVVTDPPWGVLRGRKGNVLRCDRVVEKDIILLAEGIKKVLAPTGKYIYRLAPIRVTNYVIFSI